MLSSMKIFDDGFSAVLFYTANIALPRILGVKVDFVVITSGISNE